MGQRDVKPNDDRYLDPYRRSVRDHGPEFEATLWASERSQRLRFEVFTQMCFLPGKRILDAGCSRGDFAAYLLEAGIEYDAFVGIDALPQVIDYAAARALPRAEFHVGDFVRDPNLLRLGGPQVVCISGSLNTMDDEQALAVLEGAWKAAAETLLFNFLPTQAHRRAPASLGPARRIDAVWLLRWAMDKTPSVAYRQDYFPHAHDATIMMRRA
jgi:SAM-dependent methyltransferase